MIVVGAGIIGLSCAWRLARQGHEVRVFDAQQAAREASWAGAGMLAPGGELDRASPVADLCLRSLRAWPEFAAALEQEAGAPIDFRRSGAIEVAFDEAEAGILNEKAAAQAELGIRSEPATHLGWPARFYPDDAVVDPRDVTAALLTACRRRGVRLHEHEPVLAVAPDGKSVFTAQGEYSDTGVLIAAGAWSSGLLPGLPRTIPVRGHLISWTLAPGVLEPILRHGHTYLLQRRSGVLIAGASMERVGYDRALDEAAVERIRKNAARLLPALGALPPDDRWIGFRPGIEGEVPAIGQIAGTAIWTAFGHFRNGILMAPETALRIASMPGQA
ncbi:MAG: glycine oxidase ThiO [Acidobacteriota bacterium]